MKTFCTLVAFLATSIVSSSVLGGPTASDTLKENANMAGFQPREGMVPDAPTAVAIAIAVWNPVYGEKEIASERPYSAVLRRGEWTVTRRMSDSWVGGAPTAVISKKDGRVIKIYHTK